MKDTIGYREYTLSWGVLLAGAALCWFNHLNDAFVAVAAIVLGAHFTATVVGNKGAANAGAAQ